ncbi:carbohydrate porin [Frateuria defendens]|uniref:carbohydrate porin n=1 Tax=Frateuria defendens TaxID=2219559 RepID=UPI00066FED50|nr:carbohydrate porin [Frateuria defendens]
MSISNHARTLLATAILTGLSPLAAAADWAGGITPKISYTGEGASLLDGGKDKGSAYSGQLFLGADADFDKLFGWSGASMHLGISSRHGQNLAAKNIGNSTSVQEIYGGQGERLANLTLEQKFLDGRIDIEGGRTVANIHFLGSDLCAYFQDNSACGNPTFVFRTSNFTWWPVSSWGAHAKFWFTPTVYLHVGAYEDNNAQQADGEHGLNWHKDHLGYIMPYAIGYKTTADTARLPAMYEIGGWKDNTTYADPLKDAHGQPALLSGEKYATLQGRSGVYFRFEQQVTRPDPGSTRGLILFGSAFKGTSGQLIEDHYFSFGLVQKGTFDSRPDDNIAFVVTQQHYSGNALKNLRIARALAGGTGTPPSSMTMMELSYGIQVTRNFRLAPNLHYIIHPDQFAEPARLRNLDNALVAGLRIDWVLL